jgi:hypothetical protein
MGGGEELESGGASSGDRSMSLWARVQEHKIIQWGVGYLGAALALAQGAELLGNTFNWPDVVGRGLMLALIAGLPVALALAWYHGHRGLRSVSTGELWVISVLVLIGGVFFTVVFLETDGAGLGEPASASSIEAPAGDGAPAAEVPRRSTRRIPSRCFRSRTSRPMRSRSTSSTGSPKSS